jgi:hypothetical protein
MKSPPFQRAFSSLKRNGHRRRSNTVKKSSKMDDLPVRHINTYRLLWSHRRWSRSVAAGVTGPEIAHDVIGENPLQKLWPITGGTRDIGVLVNQRPDGRPSDPSVDHLGDIGAGDHHGAIVGQAAA